MLPWKVGLVSDHEALNKMLEATSSAHQSRTGYFHVAVFTPNLFDALRPFESGTNLETWVRVM